jgi:hypothetical protein
MATRLTADAAGILLDSAHLAGLAAASMVVPVPMHVVQRENPFDDASRITHRYAPVMDGVCGFAWVTVRPANSQIAKVMATKFGARLDSYAGGMQYWISAYGQSMTRKEAYASAFAATLTAAGFRAYAGSRMD